MLYKLQVIRKCTSDKARG